MATFGTKNVHSALCGFQIINSTQIDQERHHQPGHEVQVMQNPEAVQLVLDLMVEQPIILAVVL